MHIDGSYGEGGGQVLRTSLSLSALLGQPVELTRIRAGRRRPGLRPQHLTVARALAALCGARLSGDRLDSQRLIFEPEHPPRGGSYTFDVVEASAGQSAGATTLIVQAILWPLLFASGPSTVVLRGGTFVPFSPPYHYLAEVAAPAFARLGAGFTTALRAWGWMQAGGGEMALTAAPVEQLAAATFMPVRAEPLAVAGVAAVSNLPAHVPQRMARRAHNLLAALGCRPTITPERDSGAGPGAGICLWLPGAGSSALGRPGLPSEKVAEEAVAGLRQFLDNPQAAVDAYLADQLLLPMALAQGTSRLTTTRLTRHTETVAGLLRQMLGVSIEIQGGLDGPAAIQVAGIGLTRAGMHAGP